RFPGIKSRNPGKFIPSHPTLILGIMNRKYGRYTFETLIRKTSRHHKRYQSAMVIMTMDNMGKIFPAVYPLQHRNLKRRKPLLIVKIAVYIFSIQQPGNINQIEIESQLILFFLQHIKMPPIVANPYTSFMNN